MLLVALVALAVLLLATVAVAFGATDSLDARLLRGLGASRGSPVAHVALGVTSLGDTVPLVTLLVLAGVVAPMRWGGGWRVLLLPIVATALGRLLCDLLKVAVARPRPPVNLWAGSASGFAFPSGHATSAMAGFLTWAVVLAMGWPAGRRRVLIVASGVVLAVLVGLSRIVLSVHWPTDVIGGWALGVVVAIGVVALAGGTPSAAETRPP